jgi:hypothetical protein
MIIAKMTPHITTDLELEALKKRTRPEMIPAVNEPAPR